MKAGELKNILSEIPDHEDVYVPCTEIVKGQLLTTDLVVVTMLAKTKIIIAPNEGAWAGKKYVLPEAKP